MQMVNSTPRKIIQKATEGVGGNIQKSTDEMMMMIMMMTMMIIAGN